MSNDEKPIIDVLPNPATGKLERVEIVKTTEIRDGKQFIKEFLPLYMERTPSAQRAYDAMLKRGIKPKKAKEEIARVVIACISGSNASEGRHDPAKFDVAFAAIEHGSTASELFPELSGRGSTTRN